MQVFLPYPSFAHSVAVLDRARLGKQRVECQQILAALRPNTGLPSGWSSHPATRMWAGYESALAVYMTMTIAEWQARGYTNNMVAPYSAETWMLSGGWPDRELLDDARTAPVPPWLGDERLHLSHQRALLAKDPEWYRNMGWRVVPKIDYWWPTKESTS